MPSRAAAVEARLRASAFAGGLAPDYAGFGLANVAPSLLRHFGLRHARPALAAEALPAGLLDGAERVVLVVADGLGWEQFARSPLPALFPERAPITSVLPSTTVSALATLATGLPPAEHGLLGYRTLIPRVGAIVNLVRMRPYYAGRTLFDFGVDPAEFFPFETLVGRLASAGVATRVVTRHPFVRSELSRLLYRGLDPDRGEIDGYVGIGDALVRARRFLEETRGERAFLEVYWDEVDSVAHRFGPASEEHEAAVRSFASALARELLPACADGRTLLLLTADHGHAHVPRDRVLRLDERPRLLKDLVLPPTGEGRFAYLHVREGRRDGVREAFREAFGEEVALFDAEDLVAAGRFGPPPHHDEVLERVGTLVAVPQGARKFEYAATPSTGPSPLLGNHGGTSAGEMLVPLAAWRG